MGEEEIFVMTYIVSKKMLVTVVIEIDIHNPSRVG
jgi:hypothetical protein